jgi:integrase
VNESTTPLITVNQILDRYESKCLPQLAPATARDYRRQIGHLRRAFGERIASELKPRDFGPFLEEKSGKRGWSQRVRQVAILGAAFTQAVRKFYLLDHNVIRDVQLEKGEPRDRLIEDHEFEAVRSQAPLRVQLMMDLALRLGQRQGDLLKLRWSDLRDGYAYFQQGKTGKRLAIEITPELKRIFGRCWLLPNRGEYVISRTMGGRFTSAGFRALWQKTINAYCRRGGRRFTYHDIRAMCATKCSTLEEASKLLGHSNPGITKRVYRRGVERVRALRAPISVPVRPSVAGGLYAPG